jgi:hypothetical protein
MFLVIKLAHLLKILCSSSYAKLDLTYTETRVSFSLGTIQTKIRKKRTMKRKSA